MKVMKIKNFYLRAAYLAFLICFPMWIASVVKFDLPIWLLAVHYGVVWLSCYLFGRKMWSEEKLGKNQKQSS